MIYNDDNRIRQQAHCAYTKPFLVYVRGFCFVCVVVFVFTVNVPYILSYNAQLLVICSSITSCTMLIDAGYAQLTKTEQSKHDVQQSITITESLADI
jgi:hypothetical protein